jgi:hypothetical protein
MKKGVDTRTRALANWLSDHDSLITRRVATKMGMSAPDIQGYLDRGVLERVHRNVYRATAAPRTFRQDIRAAWLAAGEGAAVSHGSAAWLWGLVERPPQKPEITLAYGRNLHLDGVQVHRSGDLDASRVTTRAGIATTTPVRTLVDLGASVTAATLIEALDRGLATRVVNLGALVSEMNRLSRHGRAGPRRLREVITARGMIGAPSPSVLESHMLRLIIAHKLPVPAVEITVGPDGEYRLDLAYVPVKLAMEVDGYAWHCTPEQLRRDHRRRNRLQNDGWQILVFTWLDVTRRDGEVASQIRAALRKLGANDAA